MEEGILAAGRRARDRTCRRERKMKLNDVYTKPLKDVVEELNLTDMKVHTDDDGEVRSIELKYEPNNRFTKGARS